MLEITVKGNNLEELKENVARLAADLVAEQGQPKKDNDTAKASKTTPAAQDHSTGTTLREAGDGESEHDGVIYGTAATNRNLWILLTDGRVIFIKAGARLPVDDMREKNITKKEYTTIAEDEPGRVALSIGESIDEELKADKKKPAKKQEPVEDEEAEEIENELDDEPEEAEDEDDEEQEDPKAKAKELVRAAKKIDGGKIFVKELLEDYDVKRPNEIDDESDLEDFIEEIEEFIEDNE